MTDWKKIGRNVIFPPVWVMILLAFVSTVALVYVFVNGFTSHPMAYAAYVLSFYTLSVICIFCGMVLPKKFKTAKNKIYGSKYGNLYFNDAAFKTRILLYTSLGANLLYVGVNAFSAIFYHTAWFGILAGYYAILAVMRFLLARYMRQNTIGENPLGEWKRARVCAAILTLLNLVLSGAVLMIMYRNKGFEYHGILVYVMAIYTFYITAMAIVNIVRYRKHKSPVMTTSKIIALASGLVSMLALETAMLTAFGTDTPPETKRIMIAATGAGISVIILAMSSFMIVRSTRAIDNLRKEQIK